MEENDGQLSRSLAREGGITIAGGKNHHEFFSAKA
jgi:hypothetical protein